MRSETVKIALQHQLVPQDFWGQVDSLTFRTAIIFEPLVNLLDLYRQFDDAHQTNERHFYQELHMLLSLAAYFQICMALSPNPFHVLSATPGARMDYPIEEQADMSLYRESKEVNEQLDAQWDEVAEQVAQNIPVSSAELNRLDNLYPIPRPGPDFETEKAKARHERLRGARIKLAVFPMLKRYKPENRGFLPAAIKARSSADMDESVEGQRIVEIARCRIIYYQGLIYPRNLLEDGIPLEAHLTTWRGWERHPVRYSTPAQVLIIGGIALTVALVALLAEWIVFGRESADIHASRLVRACVDFVLLPRIIFLAVLQKNEESLAVAVCRLFCEHITQGMCVCTPGTLAY